jgi:hypothetical protein
MYFKDLNGCASPETTPHQSPILPRMFRPLFYIVACGLVALYVRRKFLVKRPPLPPSPPSDPWIGHLRSMPSKDEDLSFYNLGQVYGKSQNQVSGCHAAKQTLQAASFICTFSGNPSLF